MKKRSLVISFLFLLLSQALLAVEIVNLGDDYKSMSFKEFEKKYHRLYQTVSYRASKPGWEERREEKIDRFFSFLPEIEEEMSVLFEEGPAIVKKQEEKFLELFPDFDPNNTVILMPSLFSFNGKVMRVPGYSGVSLLMGLDFVVKRNDNLSVLFSHEFFHVYHFQKLQDKNFGSSMATPLFMEGLATYVSGVMNPERSDSVLLMDQALADFCESEINIRNLASLYLEVIYSDGENSYHDWYLMSGATKPVRRGYCLGLQMVRRLSKKYSLEEIVSWGEEQFIPVLKDELLQMSSF